MKKRMFFAVMAVFVFTFALVLQLHINTFAGEPEHCDCCQIGELKGAWRWNLMSEEWECRCNGCGYGSTIWNPNECVLECENIP